MWYVLQGKSGKEEAVASCLTDKKVLAYVPRENRLIRKNGSWGQKEYTLFPGYVFLNLDYTAENYYMVKAIPGVVRFLGPDGLQPSTLTYLEAEWIKMLAGGGKPLEPTTAQLTPEGEVRLTEGVLRNFVSRIVKIDKHSRRATVELTVCGEKKTIPLSFNLLSE